MADPHLSNLITLSFLRSIAGSRFFKRGEDYFNDGRVTRLFEENETISAEIEGTETYIVDFWKEHGELIYECSCPVGENDLFCKHCVATGLAWLSEQEGDSKKNTSQKAPKKIPLTLKGIRTYLESQEKESLVGLIIAQAKKDRPFREWLFLKISSASEQGIDLVAFKKTIDRAIKIRGFVDYYGARAYTQKVQYLVETVATLLDEGQANAVIELSEYSLKTLEKALESIDDSDGGMSDLLYQFQKIHRAACQMGNPDPETLAKRLFDWELKGDYDVFSGAALTYAEILGDKGMAHYQKLAERNWKKVKPLGMDDDDREQYGTRFRITHMMESLARASGDIEALVAVKRKDLSSAYNYLEIAEIYKTARRKKQALEWAELGIQVFSNKTDRRLREFLAEEYHQLNRHNEAMQIIWNIFNEEPFLEAYQHLKKHANRSKEWPTYREKALSLLRKRLESEKERAKKSKRVYSIDHSELVRIFLWEKEIETAWAEAKAFECSDDLWMQLADLRQESHPDESLIIYQCQIAPTLELTNKQAYAEATRLLLKICQLMIRLERCEEFTGYLESIRKTYKRKSNFMKLLDQAKWA